MQKCIWLVGGYIQQKEGSDHLPRERRFKPRFAASSKGHSLSRRLREFGAPGGDATEFYNLALCAYVRLTMSYVRRKKNIENLHEAGSKKEIKRHYYQMNTAES